MSTSILSAEAVRRALSIRDLTDPAQGSHAMQQLVGHLRSAARTALGMLHPRMPREPHRVDRRPTTTAFAIRETASRAMRGTRAMCPMSPY